uniref:OTU domain-containing protein n=1 Tax=viral metagenome TaxID=1070528 RepID=A0A6C0BJQ0_9ZZZZ
MECWGLPLKDKLVVPILTKNNLQGIKIIPDGNCLFEALARHYNIVLKRNDLDHIFVRALVVGYMRRHADDFTPYLSEDNYRFVGKNNEDFNGYLESMSKNLRWGGSNELTAAFEAFDEFAGQKLTRIGILEFTLKEKRDGTYKLDEISFNKLFPNNKFGTILIYKRAPVVQIEGVVQAESSGSSGSHYDFACIPEWLMEPFCGGALKGQPFRPALPLAAALVGPLAASASVKPFADPNNNESIRNLTNRIIQEKRIRLLVVEYFTLKKYDLNSVDDFILKSRPTEAGLKVLIAKK